MIVADTDALIDFLEDRGAAPTVAAALESGTLVTTAISRFELLAGAKTPVQRRAIVDLLSALEAWPIDEAAADRGAAVRRRLARSGEPIGMADCLVAAVAIERDALLLSGNRRRFGRIPGLRLAGTE